MLYELTEYGQVLESGVWSDLTRFQENVAGFVEEHATSNPALRIVRVVIASETTPAGVAQPAAAIENRCTIFERQGTGVDNPQFMTVMGAACLSYKWCKPDPWRNYVLPPLIANQIVREEMRKICYGVETAQSPERRLEML
jgi:hypothetical protein